MKHFLYIFFTLLTLSACTDSSQITSAMAINLADDYLEHNAKYETAYFDTKKMKLKSDKDTALIEAIKHLEDEGFVELVDVKTRKKWFSKDSVYVITPTLTQEALPYVVEQGKNRTKVKTLTYDLDNTQEATFEKKTEKVAIFNVILLKNRTPFYAFGKDTNPNSEFITRKFKAKFNEERGWHLVEGLFN